MERPRRNRSSSAIRALLAESDLLPRHLIAPLFVKEGEGHEPITSLPGISRFSIDLAVEEARRLFQKGIQAVDLFPVIPLEKKDPQGSEALRKGNLLLRTVDAIRNRVPDMCVMVDVALDPYTSHGHDGLLDAHHRILNDATVERLAEMSVLAAEAGAHVVAPSDMMDGRVKEIRKALDQSNFTDVSILSYAAKYASAFYGPFRDALGSQLQFGDKKSYQLDPANRREALRESLLDQAEGADMLLIKPALPYLDVIAEVKKHTVLPVGAYHVSGEYAMVMAAAQNGWIDGPKALYESLISIRRAGADFIVTYAAEQVMDYVLKSHD